MLDWLFTTRHGPAVRNRLHARNPRRITELVDGSQGCIIGEVAPGDEIVAPLTKRRCAFWVVTIDEVGLDWIERASVDQGVPFLVRDASGIARVIPDGARVDLRAMSTLRWPGALPPVELELYRRLQVRLNYQTSRVRFNEHVVVAGMRIRVLGNTQREPDPGAVDADRTGYRGELPTRPVLASARRRPLLIGAV